jgi:hypothetical protein
MKALVGIRETAKKRATEWLGDPRVVRFLQDPRVANALVSLVKGVGRVQTAVRAQQISLARRVGMAPLHQLEEIQRRLDRLEEEARRLARRVEDDENP